MKYLNGNYYVEVKDKRYIIHPNENIILRWRDPPKSLPTHYQAKNETQVRKNQKVVEKDGILKVKNCPEKKQPNIQQPKFEPVDCPKCRQIFWIEIGKRYYCPSYEFIIIEQKHQKYENVLEQDRCFSTRFPYASIKIREK